MLKGILRALKAGLRAVLQMIKTPWGWVFGRQGADVTVIDDDDGEPFEVPVQKPDPAAVEHAQRTLRRRDAALIFTYAGKAQLDGVRPAMAPCLPRRIKEWLPGLSGDALQRLTDAGADAVFTHIGEGPFIRDVPRVGRLTPVALDRHPQRRPEAAPLAIEDARPAFAP